MDFAASRQYFRALRLTSKLGLTAVRSRSRENNTQLFSDTLASLRYDLRAGNAHHIRAVKFVRTQFGFEAER